MQTRTKFGQSCLLAVIVVVVNVAATSEAEACSCLRPTVESSYNNSTEVITGEILRELVLGSTRYYLARVQRTFKGCLEAGDWVLLSTPVSSATCGAQLSDRQHLINASSAGTQFGLRVLSINLCSYDVPVSALSTHDLAFLNGRTVCCGDACACADGTQPVQCFADPCSVAPLCEEGACVANYCGGCNAEFYDQSGNAVCQAGGECIADEDCPAGEWCRQSENPDFTSEPAYECVPFVGEGASCNGFTVPSMFERCEPGLNCDTPDFVADAPGICRVSCTSDAECPSDEYCASDKLCDHDGACEREVDCNLSGNAYPHIECVGHGICDESNQCGWECGNPQCVDLAGFDLGPCDAILGWALQDGQCVEVSGCSSGAFELFGSAAECRQACQPNACEDLSGVDFGPC